VTGVQGLGGEPEFADGSVVISHICTGYRVRRDSKFNDKAIAMEAMVPVHRRVRILPGEPNLKTPGGIRTRTPMCISG